MNAEIRDRADNRSMIREKIGSELNKWGIGLIILGAIHWIAGGLLDPVWGILIILIGLINLRSKSHAMFLVNGLSLIFVALLNLLSSLLDGFNEWFFLGALQVYWGIREIHKYGIFRIRLQAATETPDASEDQDISTDSQDQTMNSRLGIVSVILAAAAFIFAALFVISTSIGQMARENLAGNRSFTYVIADLTLLAIPLLLLTGLGLGIAGLFEKMRRTFVAVIGIILNLIQILILAVIIVLGVLAVD